MSVNRQNPVAVARHVCLVSIHPLLRRPHTCTSTPTRMPPVAPAPLLPCTPTPSHPHRLSRLTYCITQQRRHLQHLDTHSLVEGVLSALRLSGGQAAAAAAAAGEGGQLPAQAAAAGRQQPSHMQEAAAAGQQLSAQALGGTTYDLVMLLRHLGQLRVEPPQGGF